MCSVQNDPLFWWDGNSGFCSITILHDSNPTRDDHNLVAEVIANSPSGGFTSKLTRKRAGLNGTEIGCSQSQIDPVTCRPSRTDQISSITLNVHSCQGIVWNMMKQWYIAMIVNLHRYIESLVVSFLHPHSTKPSQKFESSDGTRCSLQQCYEDSHSYMDGKYMISMGCTSVTQF